jgi:two-component system, sensor histidine kinase LadS
MTVQPPRTLGSTGRRQRPWPAIGRAAALLWALCGLAQAAPPLVEVGPGAGRIDLQPSVEFLVGDAGLTPEQARDHPGFVPNARGVNNLGFAADALWIRFRLGAASGGPDRLLLELAYPLLDQVSLTLFQPDGPSQTFEAGDDTNFDVRPLHLANPTFLVDLPAEGVVTGVLRLQTTGSLQFPLVLRSVPSQSEYIVQRYLSFGAYYGVFLSLGFLACVIFVYSRDPNFLLYAFYLASYALLQFSLNGLAHQFLWSGQGPLASRIPIVLIGTTMLCMMWLTVRFLDFWPHSQVLRVAFRTFLGLAAAAGLLGAFASLEVAVPLASAVGTCLLPLILAAGISSLRRGQRTARYFVVAWGLFLCGVSVSGLTTAGVLPSGPFTTNAMQFGSVLEVWVLALALLDRVRALREQKEAAVASANRYLRQLTDDLERRVVDRTRALQDSNARLADLARRDSLTGLLNHRAAIERLDALLAPGDGPVAVVMLDMDHFKQINDRFGHLAGDRVLVAVAGMLGRHTRPDDLCGRYGGEEFLIALKGVDEAAARDRAGMMHQAIRHLSPEGLRDLTLSASLGVAVAVPGGGDTAETVISRADDALYRGKALGRNLVVMAEPPEEAAPGQMSLAGGRS